MRTILLASIASLVSFGALAAPTRAPQQQPDYHVIALVQEARAARAEMEVLRLQHIVRTQCERTKKEARSPAP